MESYEVTATINATPEAVWAVLVDASGYSGWDSGVERVEGSIAPDNRIKVYSKAGPGRAFPVRVTGLDAPSSMTWTGGMPFGLFKAVRTFTLTPESDMVTRFDMREEFTGLFLQPIWRSMPDLLPWFKQFAKGLKDRAERPT
jgi:hypothetical protein